MAENERERERREREGCACALRLADARERWEAWYLAVADIGHDSRRGRSRAGHLVACALSRPPPRRRSALSDISLLSSPLAPLLRRIPSRNRIFFPFLLPSICLPLFSFLRICVDSSSCLSRLYITIYVSCVRDTCLCLCVCVSVRVCIAFGLVLCIIFPPPCMERATLVVFVLFCCPVPFPFLTRALPPPSAAAASSPPQHQHQQHGSSVHPLPCVALPIHCHTRPIPVYSPRHLKHQLSIYPSINAQRLFNQHMSTYR